MVHISKIDIWRISTWAHWQLQNIWQLKLTRKSSLVHLTTLRICIWAHWQPQIMYLSSLTASRMCETSSLCFSRSFSTDFRVPITCIQHYKDYVWYEYIFHQNYFAIEISDFLIVKNLRWKFVKENKKTRTRSRKRSRKKKQELDQDSDQENKKTRTWPRKKEKTFFISWSLSCSISCFLTFLFSL